VLKQRVLSAIVLIPLVALVAWLGGWVFALFMAFYAGVTAWELLHMVGKLDFAQPIIWFGAPAAGLLVLEGALEPNQLLLQGLLAGIILLGLTIIIFRSPAITATDLLLTLGSAFYLGLTLRFLVLLRNGENGLMWLVVTALTVWIVDTAAYAVGLTIGKHRLAPRISPKKSWEGFLGGLAGGAMGAALLAAYLLPDVGWQKGLVLGLIIGLVGPLGDLSESLFKRQTGVKDSSHLIPGHGGLFDRIDSFIFVAPVVYFLAQLF